jgi:hypothetical protein
MANYPQVMLAFCEFISHFISIILVQQLVMNAKSSPNTHIIIHLLLSVTCRYLLHIDVLLLLEEISILITSLSFLLNKPIYLNCLLCLRYYRIHRRTKWEMGKRKRGKIKDVKKTKCQLFFPQQVKHQGKLIKLVTYSI